MELDNVMKVVQEFGMDEIAIFVAALKTQNSKHLLDGFDAETKQTLDTITLMITAPQGTYFASEGRASGQFPPVQSIRDYVKSHNIQGRDKKGRFITDNTTAFLISRKIATLGTKMHASHFLDKWKLTTEFKDDVMQAYILDVKLEMQKYIDEFEASQGE